MKLEFALKYIIENKSGLISDLDIKIGEDTTNYLVVTDMIKTIGVGDGMTWQVTKTAKNIYNSFYKKPSFIESLKGLYCHYILKF